MRTISVRESLNEALREEMRRDDRVYLVGEDIGHYHGGGAFRVTAGLLQEFGPERVIETPICEGTIIGSSVGAAMFGMRPVAEIMHSEFLVTCFEFIVYHAPKSKILNNGEIDVPLVIRAPFGAKSPGQAFQGESTEAWFCHTPGLKVVVPSNPYDAKGLLKSAIRDNSPVLFLEHKALYKKTGEVPEEEYTVPLGVAEIRRKGTDVTVVTWGNMVWEALTAAEALSERGIEIEVLDLRTLVPMDIEGIMSSIKKTGRAIVFHEAKKTGGYGGEVAAAIAEQGYEYLKSPILRIGAPDVSSSFPPGAEDLANAVRKIMAC